MPSTTKKIRTTVTVLLAAFSFSAVAMPAVADARAISPKDRAKAEAMKKEKSCGDLRNEMRSEDALAAKALKEGRKTDAAAHTALSESAYAGYKSLGCTGQAG